MTESAKTTIRRITDKEAALTGLPEGLLIQVDQMDDRISFWERDAKGRLKAPPLTMALMIRAKEILRDHWDKNPNGVAPRAGGKSFAAQAFPGKWRRLLGAVSK